MFNVILAVVHICPGHFTPYISSGKTLTLVLSRLCNSQYYVGYNGVPLALGENFYKCFAIQFELDFSGLKSMTSFGPALMNRISAGV